MSMCLADDLQPAVEIAIAWDPVGVVGCVGKLFMEVPPPFLKTTVSTFREACIAIHETGLGNEMKSPLSKQAAQFVFEGLHPTAKPQAADDRFIAAALAVRLEFTFEPEPALDTSTLVHEGVDYQTEAFKRLKVFLAVKFVTLPGWYSQ